MNLTRLKLMKRYVILILLISMCGGESTEDVRNTDQTLQTEVQPTDEILNLNDSSNIEVFDYDILLNFTDCVNDKGLEISIPIFLQNDDGSVKVIFELEGKSALEQMPDMNLRTNALIPVSYTHLTLPTSNGV